jgi:hypothetical protein
MMNKLITREMRDEMVECTVTIIKESNIEIKRLNKIIMDSKSKKVSKQEAIDNIKNLGGRVLAMSGIQDMLIFVEQEDWENSMALGEFLCSHFIFRDTSPSIHKWCKDFEVIQSNKRMGVCIK